LITGEYAESKIGAKESVGHTRSAPGHAEPSIRSRILRRELAAEKAMVYLNRLASDHLDGTTTRCLSAEVGVAEPAADNVERVDRCGGAVELAITNVKPKDVDAVIVIFRARVYSDPSNEHGIRERNTLAIR
jgi:hypothetical protein